MYIERKRAATESREGKGMPGRTCREQGGRRTGQGSTGPGGYREVSVINLVRGDGREASGTRKN